VNGRDGWDDDMPTNLRSPHGDVPPAGDPAVEALLAGSLAPADAAAELRPLAEAFAALRVAPIAHELAGEPAARAAYRGGFGRAPRPARSHRRRKPGLGPVLTAAKLALAGAVAVGALTGVAYADVLPAPVQNLAHRTLGAPAPHTTTPSGQRGTPGGLTPAVTRADGLCQAWARAEADGRAGKESAAFRHLAAAAGGAAQVTAYCATAAHRGTLPAGQTSHPQATPSAASSPTPSAVSSPTPPGQAKGKPSGHPTHPAHPSHPPHPSHPAHPVHPSHPAHPGA
jgi:hypothetical protein